MPSQHPHLPGTALYFPFSASTVSKSPIPVPKSPNPNIVGYGEIETGGSSAACVGSIFFPIVKNAEGTYDLRTISLKCEDEESFMEPDDQFLKLFEFGSTAVKARYTYVSKEYLMMNWDSTPDAWKEHEWAIGWWNWEKGNSFMDMIEDGDPDGKQIKEPVMIEVGQAFLGALGTANLHFVSNGEVVQDTTAYDTNGSSAPLFLNYLPVAIDISDIEITGDAEDEYMEPDDQFLKKFEFGSTAIAARYTYVSKDYLKMNWDSTPDAWKEHEWAIGWWNWEKGNSFMDMIEEHDPNGKQITEPLEVAAGQAYLGALGTVNLHFNFPDPTDVPSKK